jgi:hypothetical protein
VTERCSENDQLDVQDQQSFPVFELLGLMMKIVLDVENGLKVDEAQQFLLPVWPCEIPSALDDVAMHLGWSEVLAVESMCSARFVGCAAKRRCIFLEWIRSVGE